MIPADEDGDGQVMNDIAGESIEDDGPEFSHVWYACYGSNMYSSRFMCYIQGGQVYFKTSNKSKRDLDICRSFFKFLRTSRTQNIIFCSLNVQMLVKILDILLATWPWERQTLYLMRYES